MLGRRSIVSILLLGAAVFLLYLANPVQSEPRNDGALAPWQNGQSTDQGFFSIAVWLQNPQNAGRYQAIGVNLYVGLWQGPTEAQMSTLRRFNMPVICHQNEWARQHLDESLIVAWMHGDEPDNAHKFNSYWQGDKDKIKAGWPEIYERLGLDSKPYKGYGPPVPPAWIVNDYHDIKRVDPVRPVLVNLGQGVAWEGYIGRGERTAKLQDYPAYIQGCDIVSFDIYPACHSKPAVAQKLWYVPRGVDRLRQWAGPTKPVWTCIECTQINHPTTKATPEQIKCEVWMAIIHGARGLIYFSHTWKPSFVEAGLLADQQTAAAVRDINAQVTALASVINGQTLEGKIKVSTARKVTQVDTMVKKTQDAIYVFAVDMQGKTAQADFQI
ncbi:MAG: hypothetical protein GY809_27230, partial [Planctomycetes bacterium]|nr:hypothetical protein [Planctomycetota bacterium]